MKNNESEFYVGYLKMPAGQKKAIRRVLIFTGALVVAVGAILVAGQHPFAESTFEFRQYREFRGTLISTPYPGLAIAGQGLPWLLVGPGKHGLPDMRQWDGREVRIEGERIYRGEDHMIELLQGSLHPEGGRGVVPSSEELGQVQLTGEIVDSKCYFGVMNPGSGKVHRDCAVRCISGGIPPAFLVRDSKGRAGTLLLANWRPEWTRHVAEPITLTGKLVRFSGRLVLYTE